MLQVNPLLKKISVYVSIALLPLFFFGGVVKLKYNRKIVKQNEQIRELTKLVSVGMNIDIATSLLKEKGFSVGKRHNPTGEDVYSIVHIKLFQDFTVIDNLAEIFGLSWSIGKGYAVLEVNADDVIYNIVL